MNNRDWKGKFERFCRSLFQGLNLTLIDDLAIDLGAANTRVYLPGRGLVVNEPSVIAFDTHNGKVAAVGREAKRLARRQPREIRIARPIRDGVIADCDAASKMLSQFIRAARGRHSLVGPSLLICAPTDATPLEQRAYEDTARQAGAGNVTLVEGPYAAAMGAGLDLRAARACMVVDIGAATTDIAVISGGGILYASTRRFGGNEIDRAIAHYLQLEKTLEVSEDAAEEVKIGMGEAGGLRDRRSLAVRGRNLKTGLPEEITVGREEIEYLDAARATHDQATRAPGPGRDSHGGFGRPARFRNHAERGAGATPRPCRTIRPGVWREDASGARPGAGGGDGRGPHSRTSPPRLDPRSDERRGVHAGQLLYLKRISYQYTG